MTVYFAIAVLRLGGFSWIYALGLLQFIVVSVLMGALFIFIVSTTLSLSLYDSYKALDTHRNLRTPNRMIRSLQTWTHDADLFAL